MPHYVASDLDLHMETHVGLDRCQSKMLEIVKGHIDVCVFFFFFFFLLFKFFILCQTQECQYLEMLSEV